MTQKRIKRPRDPVQLAKLIGDIATGQIEDKVADKRNPAAVELGRKGGAVSGKKRMASLSKEDRVALAKKAAEARWAKRVIERGEAESTMPPKKKVKVSL